MESEDPHTLLNGVKSDKTVLLRYNLTLRNHKI